jgi:poly-gamma-glutamate capsule biosynthesis protein CapA/YwtB (metallophosphatase superfamily)
VGSVALGGRRILLIAAIVSTTTLAGYARAAKPAPEPKPKPASSFTLQWVGDMALSTERGLPPGGFAGAVHATRGYLGNADLTVGNLEGTLSVGGASKCGAGVGGGTCFAFQAPPAYAEQLHAAGFDLVNQANNHSMDYGASGRVQTLAALRRAGVAQTGLPGQITTLKVHGIHVAFVGFAPYAFDANLLDIPAAQALIRRARRRARVVVVLIHAGAEGADRDHTPYGEEYFLGEDRGNPRAFAHAAIDAGASLVLGSGPHVIRGVERYRGRPIAYSLGNFVGYHTLSGGGLLSESGIFRVTLSDKGGLLAARWISVRLSDGLPHPERDNAAAQLVAALSREDFPTRHFDIASDGRFRLPSSHRTHSTDNRSSS